MDKKKQDILRERAEKVAQRLEADRVSSDYLEVLVFKLATERYAIEMKYIKEVYPHKDYTPLPTAPPFIFGLMNVRRRILSILDLKYFFSLPPSDDSTDKKAIILASPTMEFAILSDGINDVQKINISQIQPSLPTLTGVRQDFLKGITSDRIVILDGEKLLTSELVIVNETVQVQ